jgi:jouberin
VAEVSESAFQSAHPNCMAISDEGRVFVGDSQGCISCWDIVMRYGQLEQDNYFKIKHKEIDGDEINEIILHPEFKNKIFVHSRDNCIRLLEYDSSRGPKIRQRFFGSKCRDLMVSSSISPDGQYLVSGGEDGKPHIWNSLTHDTYKTKPYECKFMDLVSDTDWNKKYNMFSISGFGK